MYAGEFKEPSAMDASTDMNILVTEVKRKIMKRIKSCFKQLTAEQWRLMSACSPDTTTKLLIANLILEMVTIVAKGFSKMDVSRDEGKTNLGKLVEDCLKTALNIADDAQCENSMRLRELVNIQVTLIIKTKNEPRLITPPKILDAILDSMVKMAARVKNIFTCTRPDTALTYDISLHSDNDDVEEIQTSNKIIQDELNEMIGPLVDEMSESQLDSFQSDNCLEETLVESIVQEMEEDTDSKCHKLKKLFRKQFTKMWLNRIWVQLMKKYLWDPRQSPIMLAEIPELILKGLTSGKKKKLDSMSLLLKPMPRAGALILTSEITTFLFTRLKIKDVNSMSFSTDGVVQSDVAIYQDIWDRVWNFQGLMQWWENTQLEPITQRLRRYLMKQEEAPPEGIWMKALTYTRMLIARCVAEVAQSNRAEITESASEPHERPQPPPPQVVEYRDADIVLEEIPELENMKKNFFETIVEQLMTKVLLENKVIVTRVDGHDMIQRLFETAWPEIKELDFEVTTKTAKILGKNLLRDLGETLGGRDMVFFHLTTEDDDTLGQSLVRYFERLVTPPEKESCRVTKWFSSVRKRLVNIFKPQT